jgi:class 3 adenylate cyclase/CheY-like chemotaxis protein
MAEHTHDVTFLFTDIEGSTGLLQRLGTGYAAVLERHRELIQAAVEAHGGRVVDCRGDEFFAAFDDGASAAAAAVDAQRALTSEEWPEDAVVRVRMGLHRGRAQLVADGYVGLAVHHAARVSAAARGGEILASAATLEDCGLETVALGEHHLKGVPRPTPLVRVVAPGIPSGFPALGGTDVPTASAVRVALADDSVLLREGIASLLEEEGFEIVGQSGTAEDLLVLIDETLPDVAIVDIRMPPTKTDEGLRAAREIKRRHPHTGVLLLSQYVELENAVELLAHGANGVGYLLKDRVADVEEFTQAIRRVADGGVSVDVEILEQIGSEVSGS